MCVGGKLHFRILFLWKCTVQLCTSTNRIFSQLQTFFLTCLKREWKQLSCHKPACVTLSVILLTLIATHLLPFLIEYFQHLLVDRREQYKTHRRGIRGLTTKLKTKGDNVPQSVGINYFSLSEWTIKQSDQTFKILVKDSLFKLFLHHFFYHFNLFYCSIPLILLSLFFLKSKSYFYLSFMLWFYYLVSYVILVLYFIYHTMEQFGISRF